MGCRPIRPPAQDCLEQLERQRLVMEEAKLLLGKALPSQLPASLPPWEEMAYFDSPTSVTVTPVGGIWEAFIPADPHRTTLVISAVFTAGPNVFIIPASVPNPSSSSGILLPVNGIPLIFTQHDHGVLTQTAWNVFATSNGPVVTAIFNILRQWPGTAPPPYITSPRPGISTGTGTTGVLPGQPPPSTGTGTPGVTPGIPPIPGIGTGTGTPGLIPGQGSTGTGGNLPGIGTGIVPVVPLSGGQGSSGSTGQFGPPGTGSGYSTYGQLSGQPGSGSQIVVYDLLGNPILHEFSHQTDIVGVPIGSAPFDAGAVGDGGTVSTFTTGTLGGPDTTGGHDDTGDYIPSTDSQPTDTTQTLGPVVPIKAIATTI